MIKYEEMCLNDKYMKSLKSIEKYFKPEGLIFMEKGVRNIPMNFFGFQVASKLSKLEFESMVKTLLRKKIISLVKTNYVELILLNPKYVDIKEKTEHQEYIGKTFFETYNLPVVYDSVKVSNLLKSKNWMKYG